MASEFIDSDEELGQSSCASFWGPFRPVFGGHTLREAATSAYLPTVFVLIWRLAFAGFMSTTLIIYIIQGEYRFQFYSVWCHIGISLAFIASSIASAIYLLTKPPRSGKFSVFAFIVVKLFQVFATAALFLDVVFWALLFDFDNTPTLPALSQHAINLAFVLTDMLLCSRMQFRLAYGVIFLLYTIAFLVYAWIRFAATDDWMYNFLDYREQAVGTTVAYYFGIFTWAVIAAVVMIIVSRVSRCPCITSREKSATADTSVYDDDNI